MLQERRDLTALTRPVPKLFGARAHAVADYATAASFAALGLYLQRRNRRAARLAYANAAAVLALSAVTDYPGGVFPLVSFRDHGRADVALTAFAAAAPALLGLSQDPAARLFYGAAAAETAVVAATDWSAGGTGVRDEMYVTPREHW